MFWLRNCLVEPPCATGLSGLVVEGGGIELGRGVLAEGVAAAGTVTGAAVSWVAARWSALGAGGAASSVT